MPLLAIDALPIPHIFSPLAPPIPTPPPYAHFLQSPQTIFFGNLLLGEVVGEHISSLFVTFPFPSCLLTLTHVLAITMELAISTSNQLDLKYSPAFVAILSSHFLT